MAYPLARPALTVSRSPASMSLEAFATAGGLHPELVRRFVRLGLLEPSTDAAGRLWFGDAQLVTLARARRLRAGLALNYAALGVVLDLLRRIEQLEAALRAASGRVNPTDANPANASPTNASPTNASPNRSEPPWT